MLKKSLDVTMTRRPSGIEGHEEEKEVFLFCFTITQTPFKLGTIYFYPSSILVSKEKNCPGSFGSRHQGARRRGKGQTWISTP